MVAKQPEMVTRLPIDATHEYRLLNGIWYEVVLRPITPKDWGKRDVVLGMEVNPSSIPAAVRTYGSSVFAEKRRQLNKREIRRLKLNEKR